MYFRFHLVRRFWNQILIWETKIFRIAMKNIYDDHVFPREPGYYDCGRTWVSVSLSCLESCMRLDTDKYLFFSNSDSSALICAAVKAVRGRFFRSSPPASSSSARINIHTNIFSPKQIFSVITDPSPPGSWRCRRRARLPASLPATWRGPGGRTSGPPAPSPPPA